MVTELEESGDRVELVGEISKRDAIIPSAAWLSRFCSSNNSFGLLIGESKALHDRSCLPKFPGSDFMLRPESMSRLLK